MAEDSHRKQFFDCVAPCLSLASGVGMNRQDQRVWLNAAYRALSHIPLDLLRSGCDVAMRTVDHPSKIVPAIVAATKDDLAFRARTAAYPPSPPKREMMLLEDTPRRAYDHDQLRKLAQTSWGRPMVSMLLNVRSITQEQHDAAIAAVTPD